MPRGKKGWAVAQGDELEKRLFKGKLKLAAGLCLKQTSYPLKQTGRVLTPK